MGSGRTVDLAIPGLEPGTRIGEGGNAVVYRARQPKLDRDIAVKILNATDDATQRRFDREQRAMGRLSEHDGIVTVYESGFTDHGEPYLIMPLLGASLEDELAEIGRMPWPDAVTLMIEVCDTVGYAHSQGVVHRDLKPANLMRARSGRPLVADFGISRLGDNSTSLKSTALTLTPAYSPPEALEAAPAIAQSDVYSLGATLFSLIAGHPPFASESEDASLLSLIHRIAVEPVPPLPVEVPQQLRQVIEIAMAKSAAERYPDAAAMGKALRFAADSAQGASAAEPLRPMTQAGADASPTVTPESAHGAMTAERGAAESGHVTVNEDRPRSALPPEHEASSPRPGGSTSRTAALLAVLLAVVAVGAAVWFFGIRNDDAATPATSTVQASPSVAATVQSAPADATVEPTAEPVVEPATEPTPIAAPTPTPAPEPAGSDLSGPAVQVAGSIAYEPFDRIDISANFVVAARHSTFDFECNDETASFAVLDRMGASVTDFEVDNCGVFVSAILDRGDEAWIGLANQRELVVVGHSCGCVVARPQVGTNLGSSIFETNDGIWVTDYDRTTGRHVLRLFNPNTQAVLADVDIAASPSTGVDGLVVDDSWVYRVDDGTFVFDPASRSSRALGDIPLSAFRSVVVDDQWIVGIDDTATGLHSLEVATGEQRSLDLNNLQGDLASIVFDPVGGLVWVSGGRDVRGVDPETLTVVHELRLNIQRIELSLAVDGVVASDSGIAEVIDGRTGLSLGRIDLPDSSFVNAVGGGELWVNETQDGRSVSTNRLQLERAPG